jgi:hypothetical protein
MNNKKFPDLNEQQESLVLKLWPEMGVGDIVKVLGTSYQPI